MLTRFWGRLSLAAVSLLSAPSAAFAGPAPLTIARPADGGRGTISTDLPVPGPAGVAANLAGTYYVGTSAHVPAASYATLTAAIAAYNAGTLTGPVSFVLIDNAYAAETYPLTISANATASAGTVLTIRPEAGKTPTFSGSNPVALVVLDHAGYVTFDGNDGGTRALSFTNSSTGAVFHVRSNGTGQGSTNITLKSLNLIAGSLTAGVAIVIGGSLSGSTVNAGADNDNVTIQNNTISTSYVGIYAGGTNTVSAGGTDGLVVTGNLISNMGSTGVFIANAIGPSITGNTVQSLNSTGAAVVGMNFSTGVSGATVADNTITGLSTTVTGHPTGINLGVGFIGGKVTRNRIDNITSTNTGGYSGRGITVQTGNAAANLEISNNMISRVGGTGWTSLANSSPVGIYLTGTQAGIRIYYNSVSLSGSYVASSTTSAVISAALGVENGSTGLDVRNNVFVNTLTWTGTTSTPKNYAFYSAAPKTAYTLIDYNDYYVSGTQGVLAFFNATLVPTLAALQSATTGTGQDSHSRNADPGFVGAADLHISPTAGVAVVESGGVALAGVTADLDGDVRQGSPGYGGTGTAPDLGADEGGFQLTAPTISGFTPASGPVGTVVVITGTQFTGTTAVKFNATSATTFTINSPTQITATVPVGATTGPVSVTVPGVTVASATAFTVVPPPTVTAFSPTSGVVGASVAITGTNLTGATAVLFNGAPAGSFTVNSATSITATVPAAAATGKISVTTPGGTATSAGTFKVLPTLTSFTPASGAPGTVVTITGTGLTGATTVKFATVTAAGFTVVNPTTITVTVPPLAVTGKLAVTTAGGTATSAATFSVGPIITAFTPAQGAPGSVVLVTGLNMVSGTSISFNGTSAVTTYNSPTQLTATVPVGATTGPLTATNANGTGTSASSFTVVSGAVPKITSFTPTANVVAGTVISLTGTNFTGATLVRFNNVNATSYTVNSATSITATVPVGATTGKVYVATPSGMGQSATSLTIIQPPTIAGFTPASGPAGTLVTINGTSFAGATSVTFGSTSTTTFTVVSAGKITVNVPAGATTGPIKVTNLAGTAISTATFTYTGPRPAAPVVPAGDAPTAAPLDWVVYPNPATVWAEVEVTSLLAAPITAELLDGLGRVVGQWAVGTGRTRLPLADLPPGLYVLRLQGQGRRLVVE